MIPIAAGLALATEIAQIANAWMTKANTAGTIVKQAQAEGRTHLTDAEYEMLTNVDDIERSKLDAAIAQAKREGR